MNRRYRYKARIELKITAERVCEVEAVDRPGEWRQAWSNHLPTEPVSLSLETKPNDIKLVPADVVDKLAAGLGFRDVDLPHWATVLEADLEELSQQE